MRSVRFSRPVSRGSPRRTSLPAMALGTSMIVPLLLALGACAPGPPPEAPSPPTLAPLADRVEGVLARPELAGVHWGILAVEAEGGQVLLERNAHLRFVPASNMKIPVTVAALALLGPDYRFRTAFVVESGVAAPGAAPGAPPGAAPGAPPVDDEGRLAGDLILAARGDPSLGPPFYGSGTEALEALADRLEAAGVRQIDGALVVDVSAWDSTTVPSSWMVGNLSATYGATGGAFAVGTGELEIHVVGAERPGEPADVNWEPLGTDDFVENRVVTTDPGDDPDDPGASGVGPSLRTSYLPESRRWVVEGTIPAGGVQRLVRAQRDPVRQAAHALHRVLEGRGIHAAQGLRIVWDREASPVWGVVGASDAAGAGGRDAAGAGDAAGPGVRGAAAMGTGGRPGVVEIAALESPPLTEIVRAIMEPSQNWMTEQLVRALGAEADPDADDPLPLGSWSSGFRVIEAFLVDELGIDPADVHMRDGSGLSAYNLLSPRAVTRMLADARERPWAEAYRHAMAEPGRSGTTLASRLEGFEGRVFAKTGTISHVNALSGYLVADDDREIVFAILTNTSNLPAAQVRAAMDDVVRELARR